MPNQTKIILGIDPGVADTGFGVISQDKGLKFIATGSIKTDKKTDLSQRLEIIYQQVKKLIVEYQPDIIGIEKLFFARNVTTALTVGQARGVVMLAAKEANIKILEFTPLQIKQAVTGSGQADKRQVGLMVKVLLKLNSVPKPDDAADALAAPPLLILNYLNHEKIKNSFHRR